MGSILGRLSSTNEQANARMQMRLATGQKARDGALAAAPDCI